MAQLGVHDVGSFAARTAEPTPRIEDHALIGDLRTAALVTKSGTIDWLCLPAFDSDACFAALVGSERNGRWKIAPTVPVREVRRRYRTNTLVLETDFVTATGTIRVVDFMPLRRGSQLSQVCRSVVCLEGSVPVRSEVTPRFAFGHAVPRTLPLDGATKMFAGPDAVYLRGGPDPGAPNPVAEFTLSAGQTVRYGLAYGPSWEAPPPAEDLALAERETEAFWRRWVAGLRVPAAYRDMVVRSLITLKACIYEPTGGIVAAPTTSLPETPGGIRNWDYRFCWIRDAALTLRAMIVAGVQDEARAFGEWILRAVAGEPDQSQIMYGLRGERRLSEVELDWLDGYEGAKPVRVGNAAYEQRQLDIYGELALAFYEAGRSFAQHRPQSVRALMTLAHHVAKVWREPDRGIWEMRGPERSFTASKVSAWTAIDRAIRYAEEHALPEPLDTLKAARKEIFDEVCREGWNAELGTFTQYYGGTDLDASLLFIPLSGFLPADDPRVAGTVAAIERELLDGGFVLRFRPREDIDGLAGDEGVFLACSFWLVMTYQMMGRTADARGLFERLLGTANDLGLFAEEWDPRANRQVGNFPQAFSHFAFVSAAFVLADGATVAPLGSVGSDRGGDP